MYFFRKATGVILVLLLLLSSCSSLRHRVDFTNSYLNCKFDLVVPTEEGIKKINGVIRLEQNRFAQISFRAPLVRSELAFLEYTPQSILVIDRKNKKIAHSTYPIKTSYGLNIISYEDFEEIIYKAALKKQKKVHLLASDFGWNMFGESIVTLHHFDSTPTQKRSVQVSNRYEEVFLDEMLESLGFTGN